ncbi:hypothetical protein AOQ72_04925 [Bradyrhizobium yuanmingense]|uniref:Uncharacterized protein n=1 Tax=Bradyrhizobium yuanmingense TaxID=108015 RepID=A0A0R3BI15_9BRAD|nr:hypothetical protein [Bradyrhizobium yuanmingense]KRP85072.1 hypothetical protein AOQ72_04925 [Bradyrhizobium yuanmingense]
MSEFDQALHRVVARQLNRAIPVRTASSISPDPAVTIGIATIKIVTEEQIQALAFGPLNAPPTLVLRTNPIGRDVTDLEPFAAFLTQVANQALAAGGDFRVWVPHAATVEALDIMGHRYWRNQNATASIVRMGEICRIIAHEATFPGQQVVADARALLQEHVVTGLAPVEEGHLGAVLAWLNPAVRDPLTEARERIRIPASGVLANTPDQPFDDRIDYLRKELKGATGRRRDLLAREVRDILRAGVLREWDLLVEGRRAFLSLGLSTAGLGELEEDSRQRVGYALANGHFPARRPDKLAIWLGQMEAGVEKTELAALEADPNLRVQAQRMGAIVQGVVSRVDQTRQGRNPCTIHVDSAQGTIRLRVDDKVRIAAGRVKGVVRAFQSIAGGGTRISIEISSGVRQTALLSVGAQFDIMRDSFAFVNYRALAEVGQRQPWAFFDDNPPVLASGTPGATSAIAAAAALRRP